MTPLVKASAGRIRRQSGSCGGHMAANRIDTHGIFHAGRLPAAWLGR
jgi:hypothetical protein